MFTMLYCYLMPIAFTFNNSLIFIKYHLIYFFTFLLNIIIFSTYLLKERSQFTYYASSPRWGRVGWKYWRLLTGVVGGNIDGCWRGGVENSDGGSEMLTVAEGGGGNAEGCCRVDGQKLADVICDRPVANCWLGVQPVQCARHGGRNP